jgi:hypothetical protein
VYVCRFPSGRSRQKVEPGSRAQHKKRRISSLQAKYPNDLGLL